MKITHIDRGIRVLPGRYITLCHRKVSWAKTYNMEAYLSAHRTGGYPLIKVCKQCLNKISDLDYINNTKL